MQREGERVFVDAERCVGCWSCVMVCPVGVVSPGAGERPAGHPTAFKCDGCPQEPDPPCVAACPTGALLAEEQLQPATTATARRQALAARLAGPRSEADAELT
jgi:carbon-monoxide dehydrogenase iron sulfur subunit